ncbi:MAG: hypothetical protein P5680_01890 [Limnospira sp. PMC 737.11]|uniref:hypothetical protein n=1 Tax=Limnospira sp. PMC 737.11 TaxID=2981095 RepID=UPI0028E0BBFE|nr:hypothetical protein [Limnospira sp. PMC 737.11]MDT9273330.1 hypothetical protein [Limnospira sp. PMC 737.11]
MARLSPKSFDILLTEINRRVKENPIDRIGADLVVSRLNKRRSPSGDFLTRSEIEELLTDQFPDFNPKVIDQAARANRPPGALKKIFWGGAVLGGLGGVVWLVNLPLPMIRQPVARTAPLLLLPSYISMDYNYRQAIALVEQADQLVNRATAITDFELGSEKALQAQHHLDKLPVWFLGYYPKAYCNLLGCTWRFTFDEYQNARKLVGRMEAQIFQEQNAYQALQEAQQALQVATAQYNQAQSAADKETAIIVWQQAIDQLRPIPQATLSGKNARQQLTTAERDFQQQVGFVAGRLQGNTLIEAAQIFASKAANEAQNPPHSQLHWQQVIEHWDEAIKRLQQINQDNPSYLEAQTKLAQYRSNRRQIEQRLQDERDSVAAMDRARQLIIEWRQLTASSNPSFASLNNKISEVIYTLELVRPGTTVNAEAQELLQKARHTRSQL